MNMARMIRPIVLVVLSSVSLAIAAPIPKADQLPPITEEMWKASAEKLKAIGMALHSYHDVNGHFPQNVSHAKGKTLLSWRVLLLPYLEQDELFKQFKIDEPYDSEHNAKLAEKMPEVFAPVRVKPSVGQTFYQGFTGENTVFRTGKPAKLTSIIDGTSNTAMVVESDKPVIWTKPDDLPFDPKKELPKLGGLFDGAFNCLLADGSIVRIKKNAESVLLKRLIQIDDGQPIDISSLQNPKGISP